VARRNTLGYPMRAIRTAKWAYIRNYEPDRWPAGDPDFNAPPQGLFGDVDRGATKSYLMANAETDAVRPYYLMAFGRRPAEELYDMENDPDQLHNIAADPQYMESKQLLQWQLEEYLRGHDDPRMRGESPWDSYAFTTYVFDNPSWKTEGVPSPLPE